MTFHTISNARSRSPCVKAPNSHLLKTTYRGLKRQTSSPHGQPLSPDVFSFTLLRSQGSLLSTYYAPGSVPGSFDVLSDSYS